ncbi:MAG: EAL domain-containing protein [Thermaerobacter sp.]|nr:EAL domain-containing protein [Thermaerobacter sp.]
MSQSRGNSSRLIRQAIEWLQQSLPRLGADGSDQDAERDPDLRTRLAHPDETAVFSDPYGVLAAKWLASFEDELQRYSEAAVKSFYRTIRDDANARAVLGLLTPAESQNLEASQRQYLRKLLSPSLLRSQHEQMAFAVGVRHVKMGLAADTLAVGFKIYRQAVEQFLPQDPRAERILRQILIERLANDISLQLQAYAATEQARLRLLESLLNMFAGTDNRDDLIQAFLQQIVEQDGLAGAAIVHVEDAGRLICERSAGMALHTPQSLSGHGMTPVDEASAIIVQAWQTERPATVNSVQLEISAPSVRRIAESTGIRSFGVWPVQNIAGIPSAMLVCYSHLPGYFLASNRLEFWEAASRHLGTALERIGRVRLTDQQPSSLAQRQHYRMLLEQGAVTLLYQPVIDVQTHQISKVEGLARLIDGEQLILPAQFLPAFGPPQLIALFEQGIKRLLRDLSRLRSAGMPLSGSINLPPEALQASQLLPRLAETVGAFGLDAQELQLTLEILETGGLDETAARSQLNALRHQGFRISLDDVGNGESSLRRMRQLPLDEVKIDQVFVRPLITDLDNLDFLITLIDMADDLGLDCVVEGVENADVLDMVGSLGNAYAQGYGIARPMPLAVLQEWIASHEGQEHGTYPRSLAGWYAQHLVRAKMVRTGWSRNLDHRHIVRLSDAAQCPLSAVLSAAADSSKRAAQLHADFHDALTQRASSPWQKGTRQRKAAEQEFRERTLALHQAIQTLYRADQPIG